MSLHCSKCGKEISNSVNFCPHCGAEAPRCTILAGKEEKEIIDNPRYCPECGKQNIAEALYCSDCGVPVFDKPKQEIVYCGKCGKKNSSKDDICIGCGMVFDDWFGMKGEIARKLGYTGNLTLTEKMTGKTYYFLNQKFFTIGRADDNDLVIPCSWVSGHHCKFDLQNNKFIDTSSNGTFINRQPEHITDVPASYVNEFNLAGSFTFQVIKSENHFVFHLGAILDEDECRKHGDGLAFDKLRKEYFILYKGDFKVNIQKFDGLILNRLKTDSDYYTISVENGRYYYSDKKRQIKNKLILKELNHLPDNWKTA